MRRHCVIASVAALLIGWVAVPVARAGEVRAGAAAVDASWHVGASAGQYASSCEDPDSLQANRCSFVGDHGVDPTMHSTRRASSYGIQSRLSTRALVVEGADGRRLALVKNDLYIPQDLLWRRTAQILEEHGTSGIGRQNLTMAVSHDHSSPYYSTISWGVWTFQDVFDVRFYDYYAERMAAAVEKAAAHLVPVRVGASVSYFDKTHRHSFGGAIADDGTPAGYPQGDTDHDLTVVRFDDMSNPRRPRPLANLVNYSLHPEFLNGNDLITADYIAPLQRMLDRRTGAITIFTQNAVGTSEPERSSWHSTHERLEFSHKEYAQAEYGARLMADAALRTWRDIAAGTPEFADRFVGFQQGDFAVAEEDRWFGGPLSHPYPGVSSCRTDPAFKGNPRIPVAGLPDCQDSTSELGELPFDPGLSTDDLEAAGIPVPENYSAPAYTGLEEDLGVHLQAFRLGDILFTVCSCEQWKDQSFNIKTRTDRLAGDEYVGFDWKELCTPGGGDAWSCPNPKQASCTETTGSTWLSHVQGTWACAGPRLDGIPDRLVRRMHAQVTKPANGWNDPANVTWAESEPADPGDPRFWGNYTHDDDSDSARQGYPITVTMSMANDYNGYIATYREYQRGDHYRKALTGWGPHSSDYMATRLVAMGRHLNGGAPVPNDPIDAKEVVDQANNDARAKALGTAGAADIAAYEAALPDDGGSAEAVRQPQGIERFAAAFFTWNGGDNFTDNPVVKVQRRIRAGWADFADQSGEIPVTVRYPQVDELPAYAASGQHWLWTAHYEAFASAFDTGGELGQTLVDGPLATPAGTYRFVVDGRRREGHAPVPYRLESAPFRIDPWSGITAEDVRMEPDRSVSFKVGPRRPIGQADADVNCPGAAFDAEIGPIDYPDSYASPARFVKDSRTCVRDPAAPGDPSRFEWYCLTCSFRPWLDAGDAAEAAVTFVTAEGRARRVAATQRDGRWVTGAVLGTGESAFIAAGDVCDAYGDLNGSPSETVGDTRTPRGKVRGVRSCSGRGGGGA